MKHDSSKNVKWGLILWASAVSLLLAVGSVASAQNNSPDETASKPASAPETSPVVPSTPPVTTLNDAVPASSESTREVVAPASATTTKSKKVVGPAATAIPEPKGPTVKQIDVEYVGPKSVSKQVILANMRTAVGKAYSPSAVEEDVRTLYATGFFVNLRLTDEPMGDGVRVIVIVQPKPLVREIQIKGTKGLKEKRVRKEIKSKAGEPLSELQVSTDADKIRELYQNKGFSKIDVNYKTDVNEEFGRAVVTFNINEGPKAFVTLVNFEGNKNLTTKELRKQMETRKKNIFSFINKSGLVRDEKFKEDLKKLRDYYQNKGFIDAQIKDYRFAQTSPETMTLTISLFEGIQYHVGKITLDGTQVYTPAQIRTRMKMVEKDVFSPKALEDDIEHIKDLYGERGYIDADVRPERQANTETGTIDLNYRIVERSQSYVEKIVIQVNNRTKDKVIRRELALAPGQVYDSVRAKASKERLKNLGYFEKVEINPQDTPVDNRKNMVVTVEEKRTGSVSFGAGFSSVDSILGFVELSQGNFDIGNFPYLTGGGQKFRTRLQYGAKRKDFTVNFTEPWFLDQRLSFGVDVFAHDNQYDSSYYTEKNVGGALRLARGFGKHWIGQLKYQLEWFDINVDSNASTSLRQEDGSRTKSSVTAVLTYDTRDSVFLTRRGEKVDFTAEVAGGPLLGQTDIYRFQIDAQKYYSLPWDLILLTSATVGAVDSYDNTNRVPIFDRLFTGGSRSVRGFKNRQIGPLDELKDPIGGRTYGYGNIELTFPIIDRVRGAFFYDMGFVNESFLDFRNEFIRYNPGTGVRRAVRYDGFNAGVGFGLRLNLPVGPLRLDFGIPVKSNDITGNSPQFHFDVGYQF